MTYTYKPGHGFTYTFNVDENLSGELEITPGKRLFNFVNGNVSGSVALEWRHGTVVLVDKFWTTAWFSEEFKQ